MNAHGVAIGPSRHFVATPDEGRFRTEADMNRQSRPAASVANDRTARSADHPKLAGASSGRRVLL
jgi:hypothetical protein